MSSAKWRPFCLSLNVLIGSGGILYSTEYLLYAESVEETLSLVLRHVWWIFDKKHLWDIKN